METAQEQHEADLQAQAKQHDLRSSLQDQQRNSSRQLIALLESLVVRATLTLPCWASGLSLSLTCDSILQVDLGTCTASIAASENDLKAQGCQKSILLNSLKQAETVLQSFRSNEGAAHEGVSPAGCPCLNLHAHSCAPECSSINRLPNL